MEAKAILGEQGASALERVARSRDGPFRDNTSVGHHLGLPSLSHQWVHARQRLGERVQHDHVASPSGVGRSWITTKPQHLFRLSRPPHDHVPFESVMDSLFFLSSP